MSGVLAPPPVPVPVPDAPDGGDAVVAGRPCSVITTTGSPAFEAVCRRFSPISVPNARAHPALWIRIRHPISLMPEARQTATSRRAASHSRMATIYAGTSDDAPCTAIWERFEAAERQRWRRQGRHGIQTLVGALCLGVLRGGDKSEARFRLRGELDFWRPTAGYAMMIDRLTDGLFSSLEEA